MKVLLMFTISRPDNPYKELLAQSLVAAGADVRFPIDSRLVLWRSVRACQPDVVHLHWQHGYFVSSSLVKSIIFSMRFFAQFFALRLLRVPFVWTVHNIVNHEKRFARWELMMCRVLARGTNLLIVHCPSAAAEVAAAYGVSRDRIRVVPHGHFRDAYPVPVDRSIARQGLGVEPEALVLLFLGQIRRYKGVRAFLRAFGQLPSKKIQVVIAGQPKSDALAHELLAEASRDPRIITQLGFIPDDLLVACLSACDIVVLPYKDSLTSGVAILAASYGKPVLAPRLGCMRDFPAGAVISFDPKTPRALKDALARVEKAPLGAMGKAAKSYVSEFSWSLVSDLMLKVYREVMVEYR